MLRCCGWRNTHVIEFEAQPEHGLKVIDELDRWSFILDSADVLFPTPSKTEDFPFPVDNAISIEATELSYCADFGMTIRDADGEFLSTIFKETATFPRGTYYIDVSTRAKSYLRVHDTTLTVTAPDARGDEPATIRFGQATDVDVGVRSAHSRPVGTITTTDDPQDIMRAISYLGSSLKEISCERSWPTLRGHPPRIERGNTFRVPRGLEKPNTGITIEVPASYETIYPIAPLAFYMGASVVEGDSPRIRTTSGFTYDLDENNLGGSAYQVLKHCLTLDALTRNGGYFEYNLSEEKHLAKHDSVVDMECKYDAPIAKQVEQYLSIPLEDVQPHVPRDGTKATLRSSPKDVELLPFLASELHCVQVTNQTEDSLGNPSSKGRIRKTLENVLNRTQKLISKTDDTKESRPHPIWQNDGLTTHRATSDSSNISMGVTQLMPEAHMNQIRRKPLKGGEFAVAVVCNDDEMWCEVEQATREYASQASDGRSLTVDIERNITTDGLANLLMGEYQFFHYIGHTSPDGFICSDGTLDVRTLPYIGVEGFLLNACESYEQGLELIRKGSIGGIATLCDVVTNRAVEMGARLSSMLNLGYPLGPAFHLSMKADPILTGQYRVLGNANVELRRMEGGDFVFSLSVESQGKTKHKIVTKSYSSTYLSLGGIARSYANEDTDEAFLVGAEIRSEMLSLDTLLDYLEEADKCAVFLSDGTFHWTDEVTREDVLASVQP